MFAVRFCHTIKDYLLTYLFHTFRVQRLHSWLYTGMPVIAIAIAFE